MAIIKFANNASSRLAASISSSDTQLSVTPGEGSKFPTTSSGEQFPLTIVKADGQLEIVRVTARSGDLFTITRGQESVSAKPFTAGDRVELRITEGTLEERYDQPIAANTAAIEANSTAIEANATAIETNATDIQANSDAIAENAAQIANVAADYYGDVDPTTIEGLTVGPGFKWAHATPELLKRRNAAGTAWVDLGPLLDYHYTRGNILGTVSQSGGVPTGALVQHDSNSNGEYWRYAGGMQICLHRITSNATVSPSTYVATGWTFPAGFVSAPNLQATLYSPVSNQLMTVCITPVDGGSSAQTLLASESAGVAGQQITVKAVGRWHP